MLLITDGTTGVLTKAIVVERYEDVEAAIRQMEEVVLDDGGDPAMVTVNHVGGVLDPAEFPDTHAAVAGLASN